MKPLSNGLSSRFLISVLGWLGILLLSAFPVSAQDIPIRNPSLEGVTRAGVPASPWYCVSKSPDTQPGLVGISLAPSNGRSYIGAVYSNSWEETFSQDLEGSLKAGHTYTLSFDLAYPPQYSTNTLCAGSFAIYAGNALGEKAETLWVSGAFYNTDWKRYTATFTPTRNYSRMIFGPYLQMSCGVNYYTGALVDNFSPSIREVPQISVSARNTCKGLSTGQATVSIDAGTGPFSYEWMPNGATTSKTDHLQRGKYTVKVTSHNGTETTAQVDIGEESVAATASVTMPTCHGLTDAQISIAPEGGTAPYTYSYNGGNTYSDNPTFVKATAGDYAVKVKDAFGCSVDLQRVHVDQPDALSVLSLSHLPTSCAETTDGKISLAMQGGTPPYQYKVSGVNWQYDSTFTNLAPGEYAYQVRDGHDCPVEGNTEIEKDPTACAVKVPTAFTPNGDGLNDRFRLYIHDAVTNYRLSVYNRWGKLVFTSANPGDSWDGDRADEGGYLWILIYTDSHQQARKQMGSVVLIR